jgi:two-component system, OmpR family, phosphate regulon sensor histidine kinase PhoR
MDTEQLFSELDLDATLEVIGSAVMVYDREGHLVATNAQLLRMFHMGSLAEVIDEHEGRTHRIRIQTMEGIPVAHPRELVERALTGKQIIEDFERVLPCEGKPHMVVRVCVTPLLGRNGRVIGAIKLIREVTAEYELAQRTREFVRVTSHELRTPATVLRLQAQGLLRSPERARACAEAIDRATRRIETLSVKLHDIATVAAGQPIAIQPSDLRLDALVSDVVQSLEPAQSVRVHTRASPAEVHADPARMREVVEALLDNALRYSEASASVDVDVGRRDGHAELSVADHGVGIPEDKQRHVFEQFYRAHVDTAFDRGGLGASLYLADQIMKLHGGRIWFESKRGQGSTFHLAL